MKQENTLPPLLKRTHAIKVKHKLNIQDEYITYFSRGLKGVRPMFIQVLWILSMHACKKSWKKGALSALHHYSNVDLLDQEYLGKCFIYSLRTMHGKIPFDKIMAINVWMLCVKLVKSYYKSYKVITKVMVLSDCKSSIASAHITPVIRSYSFPFAKGKQLS